MREILPSNRGIDLVIFINGEALAGQKSVTIKQNTAIIDITNQITKQWRRILPGVKSWNIDCNGLVIKNEKSFNKLEQAYLNNEAIEIQLTDGNKTFRGMAYISNFPINISYNNSFLYNLTLQGNEELLYVI